MNDPRDRSRILHHYRVEKELANRLRHAAKNERATLYRELYNELYKLVPDHPQLGTYGQQSSKQQAQEKWQLLKRFVKPTHTYLELGVGDGALVRIVKKHVAKVWAVDVSDEITGHGDFSNVTLALTDGSSVPVPKADVDVALSSNLMEHLHPDDADTQLRQIFRALKPGGRYVLFTPNALAGPHDVSKYFDQKPTGFHLHEYRTGELARLLGRVGFSKVVPYFGGKGIYARGNMFIVSITEAVLRVLPFALRRTIANTAPMRAILGVILVAQK